MYCVKCGAKLAENAAFCHVCGNAIDKKEESVIVNDSECELMKSSEKYGVMDIFFVIASLFVALGGLLPLLKDGNKNVTLFTLMPLTRDLMDGKDVAGVILMLLAFVFWAFGVLCCITFIWNIVSHKFIRRQGIYALGNGVAFIISMMIVGVKYEFSQTSMAWCGLFMVICAMVLLKFKEERDSEKILYKKNFYLVQGALGIILLLVTYVCFFRPVIYQLTVTPVVDKYSSWMMRDGFAEGLAFFPKEIRDEVESQFVSEHCDLGEYYWNIWGGKIEWFDGEYDETYEYSMDEYEKDSLRFLEETLERKYGYKCDISAAYDIDLNLIYSKDGYSTLRRKMSFQVGLIGGKWYVVDGFLNWCD